MTAVRASGPASAGVRDGASSPPAQDTALVGRGPELAAVDGLLGEVDARGGALVLWGEPGVGRTALLDAAVDRAHRRGVRVLRGEAGGARGHGVPAGAAGVLGLISRGAGRVDGRPPHRGPGVLRSSEHPSADRLTRLSATLGLLRDAGRQGPLLLVVDDLQDLPGEDVRTLAFVARRLGGSRVGLLASVVPRDGVVEPAGLPSVHVPPLGDTDATRLVRARFRDLPVHRVRLVVARGAGNPLALCELGAAAARTGPVPGGRGRASAADRAPAPGRAGGSAGSREQHRLATRVRALPARTREALLVAALGDDLGASALPASAGARGALAAAEQEGLVDVDRWSGDVRFRHPLLPAVVCRLATPAESRAAQRAIVRLSVGEPPRQPLQVTAGADGPDEQLAGLAHQEAWRLLRRGDATAAASLSTRSADQSRPGGLRNRRLADAAYLAALGTGELTTTSVPVPAEQDDGSLHTAMPRALRLLHGAGEAAAAHRLLVTALAGRRSVGRLEPASIEGLDLLVDTAACVGRPDVWASVRACIDRRAGGPPAVGPRVAVLADPARVSQEQADRLDDAIRELVDEPDPLRITRVAGAGLVLDRVVECREPLRRALDGARRGSAVTAAMAAYGLLCSGDVATGRWEEAGELAVEGIELCERYGHRLPAARLRLGQALAAAASGDEVHARSLVGAVVSWAAPRGLQALLDEGRRVLALDALGRGDAGSAFEHASAVTPVGLLKGASAAALGVSMDLVEAAVRLGRVEEAGRHAQAMRDAPARTLSPRLAMLTAASAALTSEPATAASWFDEALAVPGSDRWPFDRARVRLAYGEHLRGRRRPGPARVHLGAALDTFVQLGAQPWTARARSGLRATGVTIGGPVVPGPAVRLTPEERTVAGLAAAGLTNKQIARRLMVSHSTVAARLCQVFPKLGVGSRAALGTAMEALEDRAAR